MAQIGTRITRASTPDAYNKDLTRVYVQGAGKETPEFTQIYATENLSEKFIAGSYFSGFGQVPLKNEGDVISNDTIYQGYDSTITPASYALGFIITKEAMDDDPHGILGARNVTALREAYDDTMETLAAQPFNAPTSTTAFSPWMSGGDGVAMLSTAHPILSGGTYANKPSVDVDLSVAALQAARTRMRKCVNARGLKQEFSAKSLVVPIDLEYKLGEILNSDLVPYVADNTKNEIARKGIEGIVWTRLTDTNSWFLLSNKAGAPGSKGHQLTCVVREAPTFKTETVLGTRDTAANIYGRYGFGMWDWRGIDGSVGG